MAMRFQVPQFIEIEDKIFGPFTFRQFIYMLGGGGLAYLSFEYLPSVVGVPIGIGAAILGLLLTFYKFNNRPFAFAIQAWAKFVANARLYVWKPRKMVEEDKKSPKVELPKVKQDLPTLTEDRVEELSWSLDIKDMMQKDQ